MQVRKDGDRVWLFTRRGFDWTERYPRIVAAARRIKAASFTMDGETICAGENGVADFAKLHSHCFDGEAFFYAFDLLELNGEDLKRRPLLDRKVALDLHQRGLRINNYYTPFTSQPENPWG